MKSIRTLLASLLILVPGIALAAPVLIYENDGTAFVETYGPDDAYLSFYADPASDPYIWAEGMISGGVLTASLSVSEAPSTVLLESTSIVSYALLDNAPEPDGTPSQRRYQSQRQQCRVERIQRDLARKIELSPGLAERLQQHRGIDL